MNLAGIQKAILALVLCVFLPLGFDRQSALAVDEAVQVATVSLSPASPIDQALIEIQSDEAAVRTAAAAVLIEQGDAELLPTLDAIRAQALARTASG